MGKIHTHQCVHKEDDNMQNLKMHFTTFLLLPELFIFFLLFSHCSLCLSLFFLNWGVTHILYTWNAVVSSIHLSNIWHMYTLVCNYHPVQNIEISRSWYVSWYSRANMSVRAVYSVTIPLKSSVGLSSSKVVSSESLLPTEWITLELYVEEEDHMVQLTNEEVKLTANIYPVI